MRFERTLCFFRQSPQPFIIEVVAGIIGAKYESMSPMFI
jgi:hypothetical protein